ncbi:hypothetical protein N431DRAFT_404069 [Stipitochalara longipes BDJ]|nr:hypothetical protein N431DRAFT_404069 [Stipitochalara longipes BDJ]
MLPSVQDVVLNNIEDSIDRIPANRQRARNLILILLWLGTATISGIAFANFISKAELSSRSSPSEYFPFIPEKSYTFEGHPQFIGPPSNENDASWAGMLPVGTGYIVVNEPEKYGLAGLGLANTKEKNHFGVSVFHQLHCLGLIRQAYFDALTNNTRTGDRDPFQHYRHKIDLNFEEHVGHCLDYLRQAVMCAADMTIEVASEEIDMLGISGWSIEHRHCKDWNMVWDLVMSNQEA